MTTVQQSTIIGTVAGSPLTTTTATPFNPEWNYVNGTKYVFLASFDDPLARSILLVTNGVVRFLLGIVAIVSNAFLVYVVARTKDLWNSTGILLAALGICDAVVGASSVVSLWYGLRIVYRVPMMECMWAVSYAVYAFYVTVLVMFFLGLDRLLAAFFPLWYSSINSPGSRTQKRYCAAMIAASLVIAGVSFYVHVFLWLPTLTIGGGTIFKCSVDDLVIGGPVTSVLNGFSAATIVCYVLIWLMVHLRKANLSAAGQNTDEQTRRMLRTLYVLVATVTGCWFLCFLLRWVFAPPSLFFAHASFEYFILYACLGMVTIASESVNTFVLYTTSSLYRRYINAELKRIAIGIGISAKENPAPGNNRVGPAGPPLLRRERFQQNQQRQNGNVLLSNSLPGISIDEEPVNGSVHNRPPPGNLVRNQERF